MDVTRVKLAELRRLSGKYPGLLDAFLMKGEIQGDAVAVNRADFNELNGRFFGDGFKLGTTVHAVLAPVVRVVDRVLGTNLQGCAGCGSRELRLNVVAGKGVNQRGLKGKSGLLARFTYY
jgi:hypothetical protein